MNILYHKQGFIFIVLLYCCLITSKTDAATEETSLAKIQDEYNLLLDVLSGNLEWKALPDPTMNNRAKVVTRLWTVVSEWTLAYLEKHPNAKTTQLIEKLNELDSLGATVVQLNAGEQSTYAISANIVERSGKYSPALSGTVFIVKQIGTTMFQVVWSIKDVADQRPVPDDEFGAWSDFCRCNGPFFGYIDGLPPSHTGQPRFYIRAVQATGIGEMPRQISIWEWNGHEVRPLLIQTYRATAETEPATFDGEYITVTIKEDYVMVWSCDMNCPGAEVIWKIKVTPNGIEDIGRTYVEADMKLLSNLWDRILHHKKTDDLASSQVVETIQNILEMVAGGSLGQGGNQKTISTNPDGSRILCIHADDLSNYLLFEIENNHGSSYFSNALIMDDCENCCGRLSNAEIDNIKSRITSK